MQQGSKIFQSLTALLLANDLYGECLKPTTKTTPKAGSTRQCPHET